MKKCWADCMGSCGKGFSREHLLTAGLWKDRAELGVKGLRWCRNDYKFISVENYKSNILCRHHNSGLSETDDAAIHAFDSFRQMGNIHRERADMVNFKQWAGRFDLVVHRLNGRLLERWFLKTLINLEVADNQGYPIGPSADAPSWPSSDLVEIALGRAEFTGKAGLYFVTGKGEGYVPQERVSYNSQVRDSETKSCVAAGFFMFHGFRFWVCLEPEGWPNVLPATGKGPEAYLVHHVRSIEISVGTHSSQRITFDW